MSKKNLVAPTEAEVLAAKKVMDRKSEVEWAAKEAEARKHIGKHFRYRNSSGSGKKWWLYFKATGARGGVMTGWSIERTVSYNGLIQFTPKADAYAHLYSPISEAVFRRGVAAIKADFLRQIAR